MRIGNLTLDELLAALSARTPTPGGGAVAPVLAALATALGRMVIGYAEGKAKFAEHQDLHQSSLAALRTLSDDSLAAAEADAKAYEHLSQLMKLDKTDARRQAEWTGAVEAAIAAPRAALELAGQVLDVLEPLVGRTSRMLASDLAIAAITAECAARAAAWNIRINLPLLEDDSARGRLEQQTAACVEQARALGNRITTACAAGT